MACSDGEDKEIGFRLILQLASQISERDDIDVGLYNGTKIVCLEQRLIEPICKHHRNGGNERPYPTAESLDLRHWIYSDTFLFTPSLCHAMMVPLRTALTPTVFDNIQPDALEDGFLPCDFHPH
ncbi:Hypothetical predicted protein [Olea europaea subsp. europaea]|uniref:Uncharacterized protein n=1 Tax=Olea europaea subsp. europaea TaxID=158383 RepID=A0A8S0TTK7_OLEEU|nr:Hypothetical predicted protein [Olea europaea subsp. europaea]